MRTFNQAKSSINTLSRNTKALRDKYHEALCEAAGFAFQFGDVRLFNYILDAASGMNRKQITKWIHANGFARLDKDGTFRLNKKMRKEADFEHGDDVIAYLLEQPKFYESEETKQQVAKELDICARIQSVINSAAKDDAVVKAVDFEQYRALRAQLDALVGAA